MRNVFILMTCVSVGGCAVMTPPAVVSSDGRVNDLIMHSTVYRDNSITLRNGGFRSAIVSGAAAGIAVALIDDQAYGRTAGSHIGIVVAVTELGGSGAFRELLLLAWDGSAWVNTDTVLLGDRIKVTGLSIEGETVLVNLQSHGPDDPMCCPSRQQIQRFRVVEDRLLSIGSP